MKVEWEIETSQGMSVYLVPTYCQVLTGYFTWITEFSHKMVVALSTDEETEMKSFSLGQCLPNISENNLLGHLLKTEF